MAKRLSLFVFLARRGGGNYVKMRRAVFGAVEHVRMKFLSQWFTMIVLAGIFGVVGLIIFVAQGEGTAVEPVQMDATSAETDIQTLIVTPNPEIQLFPTQPPQPTEPPVTYQTHSVGAGDTLADIAARYGVTWQEIADLNSMANPNALEIGQELRIPDGNSP